MDNFILLLLGSILLASLAGLLITIFGVLRAPLGFQHQDLFHFGNPPAGLIPVETDDSTPHYADWI